MVDDNMLNQPNLLECHRPTNTTRSVSQSIFKASLLSANNVQCFDPEGCN